MSIFCTEFCCLQKKLFKKITGFGFSTLDHDLYIFGTCCNYFLCFLDPGKSTGNNYSITWVTKKILTQEKHIFSVLPKSNVDEAKSQVEISTFFDWSYDFKTVWRSQKWLKNVRKTCFRKLRHRAFQRTLSHEHTTKIECSGYPISI